MCLNRKFQLRFQLNTDGAVTKSSSIAMIRGGIRDRSGSWILGYNRFVGPCSILDAELWGILKGLVITLDRGFDSMIILLDSPEVVQAIRGSFPKFLNFTL
ncbi:hypothetical protein Godav_015164, partial [Gossypium davidsonii]|nr:hypothetical protein [Gossypium davidsonii]